MNNIRRFALKYEGDPDLQPIRSYECVFLARFFYQLCAYLNKTVSVMLKTLSIK